jgi:hypothetical protein
VRHRGVDRREGRADGDVVVEDPVRLVTVVGPVLVTVCQPGFLLVWCRISISPSLPWRHEKWNMKSCHWPGLM